MTVAAGELVRFPPGEYQRGWNRGDDHAELLALATPRSTEQADVRRPCEACGELTPAAFTVEETTDDATRISIRCERCGAQTGRVRRVD